MDFDNKMMMSIRTKYESTNDQLGGSMNAFYTRKRWSVISLSLPLFISHFLSPAPTLIMRVVFSRALSLPLSLSRFFHF